MPPEQDDRDARQIEALRRYVAGLGNHDRERVADETDQQERLPRRRPQPLLPWLVLTVVLVAAALVGGVMIGAARQTGREAPAESPSAPVKATPASRITAPVATPECKTAVDRANRSLAIAVRLQGVTRNYTRIMNNLRDRKISGGEAVARAAPYLVIGSIESAKFDSALGEYRKVVDKCRFRAPRPGRNRSDGPAGG
jgi:hypothetical protein